jgi:RNA polymerase-binding transcription factor DksA
LPWKPEDVFTGDDMAGLTEQDLAALREALDQRERVLGEEVRSVDAEREGTPRDVPGTHVEDLGEQGEQRTREAVRHAERERDIEELRAIEAARGRMADGSYGECSDCGSAIPLARLQVQPTAQRCVACQSAYETTHRPVPPVQLPPLTS